MKGDPAVEMPKASQEDKDHFRTILPEHPDIVVKPMFGNLGAFINGNMFAGLLGRVIGVKLAPTDKAVLESEAATVPFGPADRPMRDYTGLPQSGQDGTHDDEAARWVGKAFEHVAALPAKAPKPPKTPKVF